MRKLLPFRFLLRNPRFPRPSPSSPSPPPTSAQDFCLTPLLSRISSNTSSSWHRGVRSFHSTSLGFGTTQILSRQTMENARFYALLQSGARSLRISLQRRRFGQRWTLGSPRRFWQYLTPTPEGVVLSLIGANVAVFYLWRIADPAFMRKHFMISLDNIKSGRLHTMLTSAFSHAELDHLVTNMIGLYFFGTSISRLFGPAFVLKLYTAGAIGGSIFFLLHTAFASSSKGTFGWDYSRVTGLGASGAVNSIILLDILLFPKNIYYLYLLIPVPAMLMGAIIIGTDLWRVKQGERDVSGSAHLGGAVVAALAWIALKKGLIR